MTETETNGVRKMMKEEKFAKPLSPGALAMQSMAVSLEVRESGGFRCLLLDPPWNEQGGGKVKRGADRHYPLVKSADMFSVITSSGLWMPANDAHMWMWTTNNKLEDALSLGRSLGFTYKNNVPWIKVKGGKLQIGIGQYLRGSHELLLFFVRGKGQSADVWNGHRDVRSVIFADRTRHSEKPSESYDLIERVTKGPRVEFFARSGRPGWLAWGNEIGNTHVVNESDSPSGDDGEGFFDDSDACTIEPASSSLASAAVAMATALDRSVKPARVVAPARKLACGCCYEDVARSLRCEQVEPGAGLSDVASHIHNGVRVCDVCGDDLEPGSTGATCRPCTSDREAATAERGTVQP